MAPLLRKLLHGLFLTILLAISPPALADGDEQERLKRFGQQNFLTGNTLTYKIKFPPGHISTAKLREGNRLPVS